MLVLVIQLDCLPLVIQVSDDACHGLGRRIRNMAESPSTVRQSTASDGPRRLVLSSKVGRQARLGCQLMA